MIGKTLGHYKITGLLGKGAMGEVYRAEDTKLGRAVALKVLPKEMAAQPERFSRFRLEAKVVAGLNHPNIVTLYSLDEASGLHFLTMELVRGQSLDKVLPPEGFNLEQILAFAIPIAEAMVSAHSRGIVHRDLKPGNVMVTGDGEHLKVLDFGLAKLSPLPDEEGLTGLQTTTATRAGAVLGTPHYMSPEQACGALVDHRSDIFSFGVIIYEMATGQRPFRGTSSIEVMSSVLRDSPPSLADLRPALPEPLVRIVDRCLAKSPEERYASAIELVKDLTKLKSAPESGSAFHSSVPTEAADHFGPPPLREGPGPAKGWYRGRVGSLLTAALLLIAVGMVVVWGVLDQEAETGGVRQRQIVAVLPFQNLGSKDDEYFAEGITDEITSRLGLIHGLGVISRTSARVYAGTQKSVREIGRELNTDFVLEGSVRWDKSGNPGHVRISPRLIRVSDDTRLWSDNYDRQVTEIFSLQSEIASRIAAALDVTLMAGERRALSARPTESIDAYQAFLQGMKQLQAPGFSRDSFGLGIQMFERAIRLDPSFALAHARLSSMNARMYHYGYDRSPERLARAMRSAERALELQPELAEAHLALGHYYYWGMRDYARALEALSNARRISPNDNEIWLTTAYVKRRQGDLEAAIEFLERDRQLSPLDPNAVVGLGETYGTLRRYREGEKNFRLAIALAPGDPYPYTELALLYLRWRGDVEAARAALQSMPPVASGESHRVSFLVELLGRNYPAALARLEACSCEAFEAGAFYLPTSLLKGMTRQLMGDLALARTSFESSLAILEKRMAAGPDDNRIHNALGLTYAGLGRVEEAVRHGRRAVELYPLSKDALEAPVQVIHLALIYTMTGESEAALKQLESVLSIPSILSTAWLEKDPRWDPLRGEAAYRDLIRRYDSAGLGGS